jgi:hypothetical protein
MHCECIWQVSEALCIERTKATFSRCVVCYKKPSPPVKLWNPFELPVLLGSADVGSTAMRGVRQLNPNQRDLLSR